MTEKRLKQFILTGVSANKTGSETSYSVSTQSSPASFDYWIDGTFDGKIGNADSKRVYSLHVYGIPGTQFYLNDGIVPVELGPSGYYGVELPDETYIEKISFIAENLYVLYSVSKTEDYVNMPLIIDVKCK